MQCKIIERTKHFIDEYRFYSLDKYVQLDEICKQIEVNFNSGKKRFDRKGIEGDRYTIELVSYKWNNALIIAVVERVKECSLKTVTIYPEA